MTHHNLGSAFEPTKQFVHLVVPSRHMVYSFVNTYVVNWCLRSAQMSSTGCNVLLDCCSLCDHNWDFSWLTLVVNPNKNAN